MCLDLLARVVGNASDRNLFLLHPLFPAMKLVGCRYRIRCIFVRLLSYIVSPQVELWRSALR